MATIGQALTSPESGWRRYDDTDGRIQYNGSNWSTATSASYYNSTIHAVHNINNSVTFKFYGTKLRIIGALNNNTGNNIIGNIASINIDGTIQETVNYNGSLTYMALNYEKVGLTLGIHTVTISLTVDDQYMWLDAIDIDSTGDLLGTGIQLTTPETGWRRYDNTDSRFQYIGSGWTSSSGSQYYGGSTKYTYNNTDSITFKFYGSKLRILATNDSYSTDKGGTVTIDGIVESYTQYYSNSLNNVLVYEKTGLSFGFHTITITATGASSPNKNVNFDAIDIDSTGYLLHPTLNQVSDITSMQIGDVIPCRYIASTSGNAGYFSELGTSIANEISTTGTATPNGLFYLIKTAKGTLVADRVIQTSISWDTLNVKKYIEGNLQNFNMISSVPIMTNYTVPSGVVIVSAAGSGNEGYRAFCGDGATTYWAGAGTSGYIGYQFTASKKIIAYSITSALATCAPNTWTFEASNNGSTWTILQSMNESNWLFGETRVYNVINNNSYLYYRINISGVNGGSYLYVGEVGFYENQSTTKIRSLSGGVAYVDSNGNSSTTDQGLGAWPANNEWDTYLVKSTLNGKITSGDDNIWHWSNFLTWCKDTPINSIGSNTNRVYRGRNTLINFYNVASNNTTPTFRPVLNYIESDIANEVIY